MSGLSRANAFSCLVTCEHGGNRIPAPYRPLFRNARHLLDSHRGYDPGALTMAKTLARALQAPLVASTVSRLLVELNRSPWNPRVFSSVMRLAPEEARHEALERYYVPYRKAVEAAVRAGCARGARVIHVSSHSFTPRLDGVVRTADVGLLYDPARQSETALSARWQAALQVRAPGLRVRRNYPYAGWNDGLTTYLRTRFADRRYSGIELEVNQRYPLGQSSEWRKLRRIIVAALHEALADVSESAR
jgi:predicted N-formylglutamate amidohydrolase